MQEPLVLVGFGKHSLIDLLQQLDSPEGYDRLYYAMDRYHWPPRYRRPSICTEEEIAAFAIYVKWVTGELNSNLEKAIDGLPKIQFKES